jgi:hypothetical protein
MKRPSADSVDLTDVRISTNREPAAIHRLVVMNERDHLEQRNLLRVWNLMRSTFKAPQCFALVHGDMIGLIALDLVLRITLARMMDIALVVHVRRVHPYDMAADPASLGIPGNMILDFECLRHELILLHLLGRML